MLREKRRELHEIKFITFRAFSLRLSITFSSVQLLSHVWLCDPMDCSTPGLPVHHQLPEFTQTDVHWVGDAIQPSHPLLSPSPPAFNLFQHQGLFIFFFFNFILFLNLKHCISFAKHQNESKWIFRTDFL